MKGWSELDAGESRPEQEKQSLCLPNEGRRPSPFQALFRCRKEQNKNPKATMKEIGSMMHWDEW